MKSACHSSSELLRFGEITSLLAVASCGLSVYGGLASHIKDAERENTIIAEIVRSQRSSGGYVYNTRRKNI